MCYTWILPILTVFLQPRNTACGVLPSVSLPFCNSSLVILTATSVLWQTRRDTKKLLSLNSAYAAQCAVLPNAGWSKVSCICHALKLLCWGKQVSGIQLYGPLLFYLRGSTFQLVFELSIQQFILC